MRRWMDLAIRAYRRTRTRHNVSSDGFEFERVIAKWDHTARSFVEWLLERGSNFDIPPHQCAKQPRDFDGHLYRDEQTQTLPARLLSF